MTDLRYRLHKQFDDAVKRFKGNDIVWSVQIMRKMVENAEDYDADVIEEVKLFLNKGEPK